MSDFDDFFDLVDEDEELEEAPEEPEVENLRAEDIEQSVADDPLTAYYHEHRSPNDRMTVAEYRETFFERVNTPHGTTCDACLRYGKVYARKLNSGMAHTLLWLVGEFQRHNGWIDVPETAPRSVIKSNEIGKLRHWDFVEQKPKEDGDAGKHSGVWRPTPAGISFVLGHTQAFSHILLYNNHHIGFMESTISIQQALGNSFDYNELMSTYALDIGPFFDSEELEEELGL